MKVSLPQDLSSSLDSRAMTGSKGRWESLSLRQNFLWTLAGNVIYGGCQWGMIVVLAKLGSPEIVGQYALGLAVCTPVILLANLQLRDVQVSDVKQQYAFGDYLGLRHRLPGGNLPRPNLERAFPLSGRAAT